MVESRQHQRINENQVFTLDLHVWRVSGAVTENEKEKTLLQIKFRCIRNSHVSMSQCSSLGGFLSFVLVENVYIYMYTIHVCYSILHLIWISFQKSVPMSKALQAKNLAKSLNHKFARVSPNFNNSGE